MTDFVSESTVDLQRIFFDEALAHITCIQTAVDLLLSEPKRKISAEIILHSVHTLKGAANSVGLTDLELLCNELENTFREICLKDVILTVEGRDLVRHAALLAHYLALNPTKEVKNESFHLTRRLRTLLNEVVTS